MRVLRPVRSWITSGSRTKIIGMWLQLLAFTFSTKTRKSFTNVCFMEGMSKAYGLGWTRNAADHASIWVLWTFVRLSRLTGHDPRKQVQFIVVILPIAKEDSYATVHRFSMTERSALSPVLFGSISNQDKKIRAGMQKVALQINSLGFISLKDLMTFVGIEAHYDPSLKKRSVLALMFRVCVQSIVVSQVTNQEWRRRPVISSYVVVLATRVEWQHTFRHSA